MDSLAGRPGALPSGTFSRLFPTTFFVRYSRSKYTRQVTVGERESSLARAINSGVSWNLVVSLLGQVVNVAVTLGLSRLLLPKDYGLMAIALSVSGITETLAAVGSTAAVTQRSKLTDQFLTGVVIVLMCSATVFLGLILWLAPPLARFYGQPELRHLLYALALIIPLSLLQAIPVAVLQRKMLFSKLSFIMFSGTVLSGGVALYLAYLGFSWQALVVKVLLYQLVLTTSFCLIGWPAFRWRPSLPEIKDLLRYGIPESLTQFVVVLGRRADDILIGKWIGSTALGIYSMAYSLYLWPIANIKSRIAQVVFPALTKIQHDPQQIRFYYLRLVALSANIGYPVIFGFLATGDLLVGSVMGEKWSGIIPLLRLLGVASLFEICISPGVVYQALGRTGLYLKNILITRGLNLAGITMALPFGLQAVGLSIVCTSIINFFVYNHFVGKLIPLSGKDILRTIQRSFALSGLMLVTVLAARWLMPAGLAAFVRLSLSIGTGLLFYLIVIFCFYRPLFTRTVNSLRELTKNQLYPKRSRPVG
jgi:O-antigen/teichoic acid export membrane protein